MTMTTVQLHHKISAVRGTCACGKGLYRSHGLGHWIHEGSHSLYCETLTVEQATAALELEPQFEGYGSKCQHCQSVHCDAPDGSCVA